MGQNGLRDQIDDAGLDRARLDARALDANLADGDRQLESAAAGASWIHEQPPVAALEERLMCVARAAEGRSVGGRGGAHAPESLLPRTAKSSAIERRSSRMRAFPISPACTIWSAPRRNACASGRSNPWVSAITPIRIFRGVPRGSGGKA